MPYTSIAEDLTSVKKIRHIQNPDTVVLAEAEQILVTRDDVV